MSYYRYTTPLSREILVTHWFTQKHNFNHIIESVPRNVETYKALTSCTTSSSSKCWIGMCLSFSRVSYSVGQSLKFPASPNTILNSTKATRNITFMPEKKIVLVRGIYTKFCVFLIYIICLRSSKYIPVRNSFFFVITSINLVLIP